MSLFDLTGHNIAITGGAGHLGTVLCNGLVGQGANVLCLSSKPHPSPRVKSIICDVSSLGDLEDALRDFGPLHGFVNCAARAQRGINLDQPTVAFQRVLEGILTVQMQGVRSALHYLQPGSSIVNVASMWGLKAPNPKVYLDLKNEPSLAAIAAAGGILSWTKYLAVLAAPLGIRANALIPGWFPQKRGPERPDYMKQITSRVPMGRIGQPQELIGPLTYLLSEASSYMTGQQLVVDGGFTAWQS